MMGKTMVSEQIYTNRGMTTVVSVEGTGVTFTEVFKRVTPKISGYYTFESEVRYGDRNSNNFKLIYRLDLLV